jgi:predicted MFS family arabinose efflux permease
MASTWWALGYGFGSLVGGIAVEAYGAHWVFWVLANGMFLWNALVVVCKG